jgi:hypothetical protein
LFVVAVKPAGALWRQSVAIFIIKTVLVGAVLARFYNILILIPAFALILTAVLGRAFYFQHGLLRRGICPAHNEFANRLSRYSDFTCRYSTGTPNEKGQMRWDNFTDCDAATVTAVAVPNQFLLAP